MTATGSKPQLAVIKSDQDRVAQKLAEYRERTGYSAANVAEQSKVSVYPIRAIGAGKKGVKRKYLLPLERFLDEQSDTTGTLPETSGRLDATAGKMKAKIISLAREHGRGLGLLKYLADKVNEQDEGAFIEPVTEYLLHKLLVGITDEDVRLKAILDLYEVVKTPMK